MKVSFLPVLSLVTILLASAGLCRAQQVALLDAPMPSSSSALPIADPALGAAPIYAVRQPPQLKPQRPKLHLLDWTMIGAAATLRVLDYTSTEKALAYPQYFHEAVLPAALVKSKPAFAAFQAGTVALNIEAYRYLVHHNMRSLARISQYMYVGVMTGQVAHNYQLLGEIPAH